MRKQFYLVEPHPDDALGSAAGILYSSHIETHLFTAAKTNDERDLVNMMDVVNNKNKIIRRKPNIVSHHKAMLEDLHWDYRIKDDTIPFEKKIESYVQVYSVEKYGLYENLRQEIRDFVHKAKEVDAYYAIPLGTTHPFHILVMYTSLLAIQEEGFDTSKVVTYVDHPYDKFCLGTNRLNEVKEFIEKQLNITYVRVDDASVDQDKLGRVITEIYGQYHYGEFDGVLEKTKCNYFMSEQRLEEFQSFMKVKLDNVLFVSWEARPYHKRGGLGEVTYQLTQILKEFINDVAIIIPKFDEKVSDPLWKKETEWTVEYNYRGEHLVPCTIEKYNYTGVKYYIVDVPQYYNDIVLYERDELDDMEICVVFCDALLQVILKAIDFEPTILHCHDNHTGILSMLAKTKYRDDDYITKMKLIYTIHFMGYRGVLDEKRLFYLLGLDDDRCDFCITCDPYNCLFNRIRFLSNDDANLLHVRNNFLSCMSAGIKFSDIVTTVSRGYASEIQTYPDFSDRKVRGIRNGITHDAVLNTEDGFVEVTADNYKTSKLYNKRALQRKLGLPVTPENVTQETDKVPLIGMVSRLSAEKGIEDVCEALDIILTMDVQIVITGDLSDPKRTYDKSLYYIAEKHKDKMRFLPFDKEIEHEIYAASDMYLMPSLSEACGTAQMQAMNYGAIPMVSLISGLEDSITGYFDGEEMDKGVGFHIFKNEYRTIVSTLELMIDRFQNDKEKWSYTIWKNIVTEFTWYNTVKEYLTIYDDDSKLEI